MKETLNNEIINAIIKHAPEAISIADEKGLIVAINEMYTEITGYSESEALGKQQNFWYIDNQTSDFSESINKALDSFGIWEGQIWGSKQDKTDIPVRLRLFSYYGEKHFTISYFRDITRLLTCEQQLKDVVLYDPVTGLANRSLMVDRLTQTLSLSGRNNQNLALFLMDLNRFKSINESFGYKFGDELLKKVAERLKESVRNSDNVAHMGGDEFALILNDIGGVQGSIKVAEKIIHSVNEPFNIEGNEIFINCAVGACLFPFDGDDAETLLKKADTALIQAKRKENENFQFYSEGMFEELSEKLEIELNLNKALSNSEFEVFYQPKVDLKSNRIESMECLIRWIHPEDGLIFPDRFIPVAEDTDMIIPMGEWVLRQACLQTKIWHNNGFPGLKAAVNLSMNQVNQKNLVEVVKNILNETGFDPNCLELELTESIFSSRMEETIHMLNQLKSLGIHMSIDDFGTGYSSLSYIKRFPIDTIKIDRIFMIDVPRDPDNTAISNTIISMAKSLNLSIVAEGVEDIEQIEFLKEKGCYIAQGYYFSKPVPAEQFEKLLEKYNRG